MGNNEKSGEGGWQQSKHQLPNVECTTCHYKINIL